MRHLIFVALLAATPVPPIGASTPIKAQSRSTQPSFAIADIHVGDSPSEVKASLRRAGYNLTKVTMTDSYRQRLLDARSSVLHGSGNRDKAKDVGRIAAFSADQRINVTFEDDSSGSRVVSKVYYEAPSLVRPFSIVRTEIINRYGAPLASNGTGSVWCVNDSKGACMDEANHSPRLKIGHDHEGFDISAELTTLELDAGADTKRAWMVAHRLDLARLLRSPDAF